MATEKKKNTVGRPGNSTHLHVSSHQWKGEEVVELNERHRQNDNMSETLGQKRYDEKAQKGGREKKNGPGMQNREGG